MNPEKPLPVPGWKWGMSGNNPDLDRRLDRKMTGREILQWLEGAETLALRFFELRGKRREIPSPTETDTA